MPSEDDPTDDSVALPWPSADTLSVAPSLHLVVAWLVREPDRVGQVACIDRPCQFGRAGDVDASHAPLPPLEWRELRPGVALGAPAFTTPGISRRQLELEPFTADAVGVRSVGKRQLFHNGLPVTECRAQVGDTLMLEHSALFVVVSAPAEVAPRRYYPEPEFGFGEADADGFVGESAAAWGLRERVAEAAASGAHVLITGASGAGKELAARMLHRLSRRAGAFVARSAATFPEGLVDAELFGSARNFPNPGLPEREGLIGAADGGTLLLDEIGELPEGAQARLLRVLDAGGEYHRLGESRARCSDFRLVAATNRAPEVLKHDLSARFSVQVHVPGFEERTANIPLIARELLGRMAAQTPELRSRFFDGADPRVDPVLLERLLRHRYTHHTRELVQLLRVAIGSSPGEYLTLSSELAAKLERHAEPDTPGSSDAALPVPPPPSSEEIARVLGEVSGNVSRAAARLGITRDKLRRLMQSYGLTSS